MPSSLDYFKVSHKCNRPSTSKNEHIPQRISEVINNVVVAKDVDVEMRKETLKKINNKRKVILPIIAKKK